MEAARPVRGKAGETDQPRCSHRAPVRSHFANSKLEAHEGLDDRGDTKLRGLLGARDPKGEVRTARHAKEVVRSI